MKSQLVFTGLIGLGLIAVPPAPLSAQVDRADREARQERRDDRLEQRDQRAAEQQQRDRRAAEAGDEDPIWDAKKMSLNALPEEVRRTARDAIGDGKLLTAHRLTRDGRTMYRIEVEEGQRSRFVHINEQGQITGEHNTTESGRLRLAFEDLPDPVKQTIQKEHRQRDVKEVFQVTREGKTWYIARIDARDGMRNLRIGSQGNILREGEPVLLSAQRDEIPRESDGWKAEPSSFERLPGHLKEAMGKEARSAKVIGVTKLSREGRTVYRAEIEGATRSRFVHFDEQGNILGQRNITEQGRQVVEFERLPGAVKNTLGKEAQGRPFNRIVQVTRGNKTYYRADIDAPGGVRTVYVGSEGEILTPEQIREAFGRE